MINLSDMEVWIINAINNGIKEKEELDRRSELKNKTELGSPTF